MKERRGPALCLCWKLQPPELWLPLLHGPLVAGCSTGLKPGRGPNYRDAFTSFEVADISSSTCFHKTFCTVTVSWDAAAIFVKLSPIDQKNGLFGQVTSLKPQNIQWTAWCRCNFCLVTDGVSKSTFSLSDSACCQQVAPLQPNKPGETQMKKNSPQYSLVADIKHTHTQCEQAWWKELN